MPDLAETPAPVGKPAVNGLPTATVILKPRRAQPFFGRHPWVFEGAINGIEGNCQDGDVVRLVTDQREFVALGIINSRSKLRIRLYSWTENEALDEAFWSRRIALAVAGRALHGEPTDEDAQRMIFSEADGISGLVVDRYGSYLVVQATSLSMVARLDWILTALQTLLSPVGIVVRGDAAMAREEGLDPSLIATTRGIIPDGPIFIREHGIKYGLELQVGQKTGFYIDQAQNRLAAAKYVRGKRVLDLFCYSGGFALTAAVVGGAKEVIGVDGSTRAIATARANAELNGVTNVQFVERDCFEAIDEFQSQGDLFDIVVVDPPKFTRTRRQVNEALRAYYRVNRVVMDLLTPGGVLVTCSCSGSVSADDFQQMLTGVAQKSGRELQILEQRGAAPDHPVAVTCPESQYLKCFICRVI